MKNKLLFLIFLMFPTLMLADYTFIVENQAMVEAYFNIFNAISALLSSEDYLDLLRLTFLLGGFFVFAASVLTTWEGSANAKILSPYGKYLITGVALLTLVFSYKEPMWVTTNNIPSFCATPPSGMGGATPGGTMVGTAVNLPSVLGFVFSTTNKIGDGLTKLAESAFSTPSSTGTASMTDSGGYLGALKQTISIMSYNPSAVNMVDSTGNTIDGSADFLNLWGTFFSQCFYAVASNKGIDGDTVINQLKSSKNIFNYVDNYIKNYTYPGDNKPVNRYLVESNGTHYECGTFYNILTQSSNKLTSNFACSNPKMNGGVIELITGNTTGATVSDLNNIALQSGLINALSISGSINSVGINGANFVEGKSRAEASQNNLASASYMAQMLPYIQMTMRAILYAFFPFVFVVMLLPGGIKVLSQYGQTILWIELWSPTAAVVNMFVNMQVKDQVGGAFSTTGLTYMSSINMLSDANTIAGVGAMLYLSIPALTWLILKGSGQMLGNVAGGVMGTFGKNLDSKAVSQDLQEYRAARKSGMSVSDMINKVAEIEATNKYGQAIGFDNAGGMDKMLDIRSKIEEGKNKHDISNVLSQGGKYVDNMSKTGEGMGGRISGEAKSLDNGGGFLAVEKSEQIRLETGLKTATSNVKDTGGASNVSNIESEMKNKEFNKLMKVNDGTDKEMFQRIGDKESSVMSGTAAVVNEVGKEAYKDQTIQDELTKVSSASLKKETSGSNENVAKTASIKENKNFEQEQNLQKKEKEMFGENAFKIVAESNAETEARKELTNSKINKNNTREEQTTSDSYKSTEEIKTNNKFIEKNGNNPVEVAERSSDASSAKKTKDMKVTEKSIEKLGSEEQFIEGGSNSEANLYAVGTEARNQTEDSQTIENQIASELKNNVENINKNISEAKNAGDAIYNDSKENFNDLNNKIRKDIDNDPKLKGLSEQEKDSMARKETLLAFSENNVVDGNLIKNAAETDIGIAAFERNKKLNDLIESENPNLKYSEKELKQLDKANNDIVNLKKGENNVQKNIDKDKEIINNSKYSESDKQKASERLKHSEIALNTLKKGEEKILNKNKDLLDKEAKREDAFKNMENTKEYKAIQTDFEKKAKNTVDFYQNQTGMAKFDENYNVIAAQDNMSQIKNGDIVAISAAYGSSKGRVLNNFSSVDGSKMAISKDVLGNNAYDSKERSYIRDFKGELAIGYAAHKAGVDGKVIAGVYKVGDVVKNVSMVAGGFRLLNSVKSNHSSSIKIPDVTKGTLEPVNYSKKASSIYVN